MSGWRDGRSGPTGQLPPWIRLRWLLEAGEITRLDGWEEGGCGSYVLKGAIG